MIVLSGQREVSSVELEDQIAIRVGASIDIEIIPVAEGCWTREGTARKISVFVRTRATAETNALELKFISARKEIRDHKEAINHAIRGRTSERGYPLTDVNNHFIARRTSSAFVFLLTLSQSYAGEAFFHSPLLSYPIEVITRLDADLLTSMSTILCSYPILIVLHKIPVARAMPAPFDLLILIQEKVLVTSFWRFPGIAYHYLTMSSCKVDFFAYNSLAVALQTLSHVARLVRVPCEDRVKPLKSRWSTSSSSCFYFGASFFYNTEVSCSDLAAASNVNIFLSPWVC